MNLLFSIPVFMLAAHYCFGQVSEKERQAILKEGLALYRLELASWNASELLDRMVGINSLDSIGGFVSYRQGDNLAAICRLCKLDETFRLFPAISFYI